MNLNSRKSLIARLRRGKAARQRFVESNLTKAIAHQIRATRDKLGWSQERLASEVGMNQNAISRLESSDYGKATITTLKRLATSLEVGLIVRFVPFSEMIDWVTGTPRTIEGLTTAALAVPSFDREEADGIFEEKPIPVPVTRIGPGAEDRASTQFGTAAPPPVPFMDSPPPSSLTAANPADRQPMIPAGATTAAEMRI